MRMREIMSLCETSFHSVESAGAMVRVCENPSAKQMQQIVDQSGGRVRMSVADDGNVFVWNAFEAVHATVEDGLGLGDDCIRGFVYPEGIGVRWEGEDLADYAPVLQGNPNVVRALGPDVEIFTTHDDGR